MKETAQIEIVLRPGEAILPGGEHRFKSLSHHCSDEQDSPPCIVAMKKEEQARLVHDLGLGKGQCHAHKTSQTLP